MPKGDRGGEVIGLNPNIRVYRYTKGQFFDAHCKFDLLLTGTWGSPLPVTRIVGTCLPAPPARPPRPNTTTDLRPRSRLSRPITSSTELPPSLSTCLQLEIADDALCRLWCRARPGISPPRLSLSTNRPVKMTTCLQTTSSRRRREQCESKVDRRAHRRGVDSGPDDVDASPVSHLGQRGLVSATCRVPTSLPSLSHHISSYGQQTNRPHSATAARPSSTPMTDAPPRRPSQ